MSLTFGQRNNNPCNIRYSSKNPWVGQCGCNKGFAVFSHINYGYRACMILLRNYIRNGLNTPSLIISRFAPSNENDTCKYIEYCSQPWSFNENYVISTKEDLCILLSRMAFYESRIKVDTSTLLELFYKFNIKM